MGFYFGLISGRWVSNLVWFFGCLLACLCSLLKGQRASQKEGRRRAEARSFVYVYIRNRKGGKEKKNKKEKQCCCRWVSRVACLVVVWYAYVCLGCDSHPKEEEEPNQTFNRKKKCEDGLAPMCVFSFSVCFLSNVSFFIRFFACLLRPCLKFNSLTSHCLYPARHWQADAASSFCPRPSRNYSSSYLFYISPLLLLDAAPIAFLH